MKKLPLSVFIIAKNEADRIEKPLRSVRDWVDEVIVIDSGSTDDTVSVAESLGARTYFHAWQGFGIQKQYGESLCKHQWILNLDADEEVMPELRDEIRDLFDSGALQHAPAYRIKRIMIKPGGDGRYFSFGPGDHFVRLYDKKRAGYCDSTVHDSVLLHCKEDRLATLKGVMLHRCFRSYAHMVEKINFYSSMQAEDMYKKGRKISGLRLVFEPITSFFKGYVIRRYFLWGVDGITEGVIYAFARVLRIAKLRELYAREKQQKEA